MAEGMRAMSVPSAMQAMLRSGSREQRSYRDISKGMVLQPKRMRTHFVYTIPQQEIEAGITKLTPEVESPVETLS